MIKVASHHIVNKTCFEYAIKSETVLIIWGLYQTKRFEILTIAEYFDAPSHPKSGDDNNPYK